MQPPTNTQSSLSASPWDRRWHLYLNPPRTAVGLTFNYEHGGKLQHCWQFLSQIYQEKADTFISDDGGAREYRMHWHSQPQRLINKETHSLPNHSLVLWLQSVYCFLITMSSLDSR